MKIETNHLDIIFSALIARKASEYEAKKNWTDGKEDGVKQASDGRLIYRTDLMGLDLDENGVPTRVDNSISLSVIEPTDIVPGTQYRAAGKIVVSPYMRNNRIAYSITAERLEAVKDNK